jgi:nucleotide-binding universal stress UspA family protein
MPKRVILVADDIEDRTEAGKKRSRAIRIAASDLADRLGAEIRLLYVEDVRTLTSGRLDPYAIDDWHNAHQRMLEEAGKQFSITVRCLLQRGSPVEEILKALRSRVSPELAILGTRGKKGLQRLFLGSVAEEVLRRAGRPVMVIGPEAQKRAWFLATGRRRMRILVATDLGGNSRAAERYALMLAKRTAANVLLFHCPGDSFRSLLETGMVPGSVPYDLDATVAGIREDAVKTLEQKTGLFRRHGVACDYKLEESAASSASLVHQEAEKDHALVIMGTHGRNMMLNAYFGSTARETILHATIPVIVVHSGR